MDSWELLSENGECLESPTDYRFPFPPYPIQNDFMHCLFRAIEDKKLGIFESPTGTGKSLSIICGSLAWLLEHEEREKRVLKKCIESLDSNNTTDAADWIQAQAAGIKNQAAKLQLQELLDKIVKQERHIQEINERRNKADSPKRRAQNFSKSKPKEETELENTCDDLDMLLEDIMSKLDDANNSDDGETDESEQYQGIKIIFCSRTHSQLTQFINEVKKTQYRKNVRVVPLASRQNYCINKSVKNLKSISLINEKCLELQKKSKGKSRMRGENGETVKRSKEGTSCSYLAGAKKLGEDAGVLVNDIEDLSRAGEVALACPYYASRNAAASLAQLVVVPYNILLHKGTREASGLKLDGNVVIVDEAHNLLETIIHIHSSQASGTQFTYAYNQLMQYKDKFEKRFTASNLMFLKQLIYVIGNLIKFLGGKPGCGQHEATSKVIESKIQGISDFQIDAEIDNFNLYHLINFCKLSKLSQKLQGYSKHYVPQVKVNPKPPPQAGIKAFLQEITNKKPEPCLPQTASLEAEVEESGGQPLISVISFLECLTNHSSDGRVLLVRSSTLSKSFLKYLLLNPAPIFKDIIDKARSVILCGGTMEPVSEFKEQLFAACGASEDRIVQFSCGHVIPPENILPLALAAGPTGRILDFSYQARSTQPILNELGRILINVSQAVPGGIVCFFPSYDYEDLVYQHLDKTGVIATISNKKKVFREPKKSGQVETVLADYANIIKRCKQGGPLNGCLLFSVVGGKLSEGLNFSDDLGRCVIVVGMPYPNIKSPELQEKMAYLDSNVGSGSGRSHYESLCMKAVNQCIGRAVRHRGDYATVLLLDSRYLKGHVQALLPAWILRSLCSLDKFGPAFGLLAKFFKARQA